MYPAFKRNTILTYDNMGEPWKHMLSKINETQKQIRHDCSCVT